MHGLDVPVAQWQSVECPPHSKVAGSTPARHYRQSRKEAIMDENEQVAEGWGWPRASRKAHYFVGSRSLCGRWAFVGSLTQPKEQSVGGPDDCRKCSRLLEKRYPPQLADAKEAATS